MVSLFVNPAQFGPDEDLNRYPRDLAQDAALAREAGVDVLYTPEAAATCIRRGTRLTSPWRT